MCLAQGPQCSDAGEARTCGPSVSSHALYHCATTLPSCCIFVCNVHYSFCVYTASTNSFCLCIVTLILLFICMQCPRFFLCIYSIKLFFLFMHCHTNLVIYLYAVRTILFVFIQHQINLLSMYCHTNLVVY